MISATASASSGSGMSSRQRPRLTRPTSLVGLLEPPRDVVPGVVRERVRARRAAHLDPALLVREHVDDRVRERVRVARRHELAASGVATAA